MNFSKATPRYYGNASAAPAFFFGVLCGAALAACLILGAAT